MSLSWSRPARSALASLPHPAKPPVKAPALKKMVQMAIRATLQTAPPRYPALKSRLKAVTDPLYAVDFSFMDDAEVQALNSEYRGKDKPTDVLSFPLFETNDEEPIIFPGEEDLLALGDLVISIDTAARQAEELKHSLEREIAFLTIHGVLHLLGYDHAKDSERRTMFARQDAIYEAFFPGDMGQPPSPSLSARHNG
ncbi:rRNA maturation RNase YbeY [bacterium]|nr:MAG: rRNA maturation RNase YbeY [bacterium]